ncbi:MAG: DUF6011 domain-containing protein [Methanotrichaceae archaeon]|jgi:recombinational DNA repair protein (RecF pathway)
MIKMEQITIIELEGRQPQHTHCMRCHRALKNTRSRGIGFGPVCERKAVADARAVKEATAGELKMTELAPEEMPYYEAS